MDEAAGKEGSFTHNSHYFMKTSSFLQMQGSQKYERAVNKTTELVFLRDPPYAHAASHKVSPPFLQNLHPNPRHLKTLTSLTRRSVPATAQKQLSTT